MANVLPLHYRPVGCAQTCRELTTKDKLNAQVELAATIAEKEDLKKQVDVRIAQVLKVTKRRPSPEHVCCAMRKAPTSDARFRSLAQHMSR
jgi:hypothetical protein